jgi:hypothetical protein
MGLSETYARTPEKTSKYHIPHIPVCRPKIPLSAHRKPPTSPREPRKRPESHFGGYQSSVPVTFQFFQVVFGLKMANFAKIPQNITNLEGKNTWQNSTKASPLLWKWAPKRENYVLGTQKPTNSSKKTPKLTDHFSQTTYQYHSKKNSKPPNTGMIPGNVEHCSDMSESSRPRRRCPEGNFDLT